MGIFRVPYGPVVARVLWFTITNISPINLLYARLGFEPKSNDHESRMLPLHYLALIIIPTFNYRYLARHLGFIKSLIIFRYMTVPYGHHLRPRARSCPFPCPKGWERVYERKWARTTGFLLKRETLNQPSSAS